jgi:hypothetical protein
MGISTEIKIGLEWVRTGKSKMMGFYLEDRFPFVIGDELFLVPLHRKLQTGYS